MTPKIECDWTTKGNVLADNKKQLIRIQKNIEKAICPNGHIKYKNQLEVQDSFSGEFDVVKIDTCCPEYKERLLKCLKG